MKTKIGDEIDHVFGVMEKFEQINVFLVNQDDGESGPELLELTKWVDNQIDACEFRVQFLVREGLIHE